MDTTLASPGTTKRRGLLWLGLVAAFIGIPLYVVQLTVIGRTESPWYAPALATLGVGMVFLAMRRRPTFWRGLALLLVVALTAGEWWFLVRYVRLPPYTGPVAAGQ